MAPNFMSIRNRCATRPSTSRDPMRGLILELFPMKLVVVAGLIAGLALAGAADARGHYTPHRARQSRVTGASSLFAMDAGMTGRKGHGAGAGPLAGLDGTTLTTGGFHAGKRGGALATSGLGGGKSGAVPTDLGGGGRHHGRRASSL